MLANRIEIITCSQTGACLAINLMEHRPTGRRIIDDDGVESVETEKQYSSIGAGDMEPDDFAAKVAAICGAAAQNTARLASEKAHAQKQQSAAEEKQAKAEKERDTANDVARTREEQLAETEKQRDEIKKGLNQASVVAGRVIAERDELLRLLEEGTDEQIAEARKKIRAARKAKRKAKKAEAD